MDVDISLLKEDPHEINKFITSYQPFILSVVSEFKQGYVYLEEESFTVGLNAFYEAIQRYDKKRGDFLSFARLVIQSRLKNHYAKENRHHHASIDKLIIPIEEDFPLKIELKDFERSLNLYKITLDQLVEASPKHRDTRNNLLHFASLLQDDEEILNLLKNKKRLPITAISRKYKFSIKVLKSHKSYIISLLLIYMNKYTLIEEWIHKKAPKN